METPKPMQGTWKLVRPDGQTYHADSPLRCVSLEMSERVPPDVQLARVMAVVGPLERRVRRVVCAAIRAADGAVLLGVRHYSRDMHEQIAARCDGEKFKHRMNKNQGFVDQWGVFMPREEAYRVADDQGQIWDWRSCGNGLEGRTLYSESLY